MSNISYGIISADSHVVEPHDLWANRVPSKFRDRAPRLVHEDDTDVLFCDSAKLPPVSMLAGCYRKDDEQRWSGRWEDDVPAAAYDPKVRLAELARDGVDAEVVFPTLGQYFFPIEDYDLRFALFQAYNDWLAEEFCGPEPDRFFGLGVLDPDDIDLSISEMRRIKEKGLAGVMLPMDSLDDDPYYSENFDPLWAAAVELEMPVNLHLLTSRKRTGGGPSKMPTAGNMLAMATAIQPILVDMIAFGVFDRFPELQVVSAENDAGWVAHLMQAADYQWQRVLRLGGARSENPPSHYFLNNIHTTFMRDRAAILTTDIAGANTMMWGNDFPHSTSTFPRSKEVLDELFGDQPQELRDAIVCNNVRALYKF
jgi:predicted TIM-barrel fold metal-dependent hydrolase